MFTQDFPPAWPGGIAVFLENICDQLQARGHEVKVLAQKWVGDQEVDAIRSYPVHRFSVLARMGSIVPICMTLFHALCWRPDIIFLGHFMTTFALGVFIANKILRIPYVILIHGDDITCALNSNIKFERWLGKVILKNSSLVFANSEFTKRFIVKSGYIDNNIRILNPGVDTNRFRQGLDVSKLRFKYGINRETKVILSVGRLIARKAFNNVLRTLPQIKERIPDFKYFIVGEGPEKKALRKLTNDLHLSHFVIFTGFVNDDDLPLLYNLCDVFVMPTTVLGRSYEGSYEGFGIVFSEAAACGKPSIGNRGGGVSEAIVEGVTGILVDDTYKNSLAKAILKLLTDEEYARTLGRNGRQRVEEELSWEKVGQRLKHYLAELVV